MPPNTRQRIAEKMRAIGYQQAREWVSEASRPPHLVAMRAEMADHLIHRNPRSARAFVAVGMRDYLTGGVR